MIFTQLKNSIERVKHLLPENEKNIIEACLFQIEEQMQLEEETLREAIEERNLLKKYKEVTA